MDNVFQLTSQIIDLVFLVLFTAQCIFISCILKFKIDYAAHVTLFSFWGALAFKVIGNYVNLMDPDINDSVSILDQPCNALITCTLTFFAYEMAIVQTKVTANDI
jgi:hypothetical protein